MIKLLTEGIIIAFITGGLAIISNAVIALAQGSKTIYRIDQLEKKVEKHNQIVEKTYKLQSDLNTAFVRIDELREDIREVKSR